jgi:hypothetical protein
VGKGDNGNIMKKKNSRGPVAYSTGGVNLGSGKERNEMKMKKRVRKREIQASTIYVFHSLPPGISRL